MEISSSRIPFWDNIKAVLIFLVVLGHTGTTMGDNWLSVIYAFHMPLFVLVSGYFSKKKVSLWQSIKKLVYIFLIFNTLYLVFDLVTTHSFSWINLFIPGFAMWYIMSLIFWRILIFYIPLPNISQGVDYKWLAFIALSFVVSLSVGYLPIGPHFSFQRTFVFLPYFLIGYYLQYKEFSPKIDSLSIRIGAIVLFISLSILNYSYLPVFYASRPYEDISDLLMRGCQMIIALALCWAIIKIIPQKHSWITSIGSYSLIIYLIHPPLIKGFKMIISSIGMDGLPILGLIISIISIFIILLVKDFKFVKSLR